MLEENNEAVNQSEAKNADKGKAEEDVISLVGFFDDNDPTPKWITKASVFTNLFSGTEYRFQLYQALHPEDKTTKREDVLLITLQSQMVNQQYNDLGLIIGTRLIILIEAQSTWSENIVLRILLYLVQTWHKYIKREKLDIYGEKKIELPKPELYVIYTKPDANKKPDNLTLKDTLFDGEDICIDCKVRVIKDGKKGDIISQYVRFCRVFDEQVRIHGRTLKAVEETIRICKDEKVLEEYLERQREEVIDIMMTLFDQETIMENHDESIRRESRAEGRAEERRDMAGLMNYLLKNGRGDDALKASEDESFLNKLLAEFRGGMMVAK